MITSPMATWVIAWASILGQADAPEAAAIEPPLNQPPPFTCFLGTSHSARSGEATTALVGGALLCRQQTLRPVAWFGAYQAKNEKPQYLYLLIFKTAENFTNGGGASFSFEGGAADAEQHGRMSATLAEKKIEVKYRFTVDEATGKLTAQSLTVDGKELLEDTPRVFVVDLTGDAVAYHPIDAPFPEEVPDLTLSNHDEWGVTLVRALEQLRAASPELNKRLTSDKQP